MVDDFGAPEPKEVLRSSLRHLSPSGRLLLLFQRSVSGGGGAAAAAAAGSPPWRRCLGTYLPGFAAAAAAAGADSNGRAGGSAGLRTGSVGLPNNASFLCLSFSSSSRSLCLCFSLISANFAKRSASSFFFLSASGV